MLLWSPQDGETCGPPPLHGYGRVCGGPGVGVAQRTNQSSGTFFSHPKCQLFRESSPDTLKTFQTRCSATFALVVRLLTNRPELGPPGSRVSPFPIMFYLQSGLVAAHPLDPTAAPQINRLSAPRTLCGVFRSLANGSLDLVCHAWVV